MKAPQLKRRLSGIDAAFLYLERKEIPLHIAGVFLFDGPLPFEAFVALIESRLPLLPRYRQVVVPPRHNLGQPVWEDCARFDIRNHIFRHRLRRPGGEKELEELVGRILTPLMDRRRPLWDFHVIDGLSDGRGALIARVHHSLADGISGASILKVIFDTTPDAPRPRIRPMRSRPAKASPNRSSLAEEATELLESTVRNLVLAEAGLVGLANSLLSGSLQRDLDGVAPLLPEFAASVERLPFNRPCTGERKLYWTDFDLSDVDAIRAAGGGTLNDVVLTVVTRALARHAKLHRQTVDRRFVRVVCPVNLRNGENGESLGNRISFLPVALPMDVSGPLRNLREVSARTEIMKRAHVADLVALAGAMIIASPPPIQSLFWTVIPQLMLPVPLLNLICTNVPGSPVPLYALGRRMLASYPQVPTGYDLGVGIAVQTYAGKLFFGLTADTVAAPDAGRLRDLIRTCFEELARAAGARRRRARAPKAKVMAAGAGAAR
jgi:diacylglycerol O-acyltransferase / wax synthase